MVVPMDLPVDDSRTVHESFSKGFVDEKPDGSLVTLRHFRESDPVAMHVIERVTGAREDFAERFDFSIRPQFEPYRQFGARGNALKALEMDSAAPDVTGAPVFCNGAALQGIRYRKGYDESLMLS
jgi:hypothetical protein